MKVQNGSARTSQHHSKTQSAHAKHRRTRRASAPVDQSNFTEMAGIVLQYLEKALAGSDKHLIKNSRQITKLIADYVKAYPLASVGSITLVVTMTILLFNKSKLLGFNKTKQHHYLADIKNILSRESNESTNFVNLALEFLASQMKNQSIDLYDDIVGHYLRKNPIPTTIGAIALGGLLTLLARKRH